MKEFFKQKGFFAEESSSNDGYRVVAFIHDVNSSPFAVVEVHRNLNEIVMDYFPWGQREQPSLTSFFSSVLTLFGAGILVKHDLKKKELAEKIENEFWAFLDRFFQG
jgi:hypothetical protein